MVKLICLTKNARNCTKAIGVSRTSLCSPNNAVGISISYCFPFKRVTDGYRKIGWMYFSPDRIREFRVRADYSNRR